MTTIANLCPDIELQKLLDNKVSVKTSATESHTIRTYSDEDRPNVGLGDEFIDVGLNGDIRSITEDMSFFQGNLMLSVYVKLLPDNRAKKKIIKQIISQCEAITHKRESNGYFFHIDPSNVITPTTSNLTSGYSTTILNVVWRYIK